MRRAGRDWLTGVLLDFDAPEAGAAGRAEQAAQASKDLPQVTAVEVGQRRQPPPGGFHEEHRQSGRQDEIGGRYTRQPAIAGERQNGSVRVGGIAGRDQAR